jgi:hypothetical protein
MNTEEIIHDLLDTAEINSLNRLEKLMRLLIVMQTYGMNKGDLTDDFKAQVYSRLYKPTAITELNTILENDIIRDLNDAIEVMLPKLPDFADAQIDNIKEFLEIEENPEQVIEAVNPDLIAAIPEDVYPEMVIDVEYLRRLGVTE